MLRCTLALCASLSALAIFSNTTRMRMMYHVRVIAVWLTLLAAGPIGSAQTVRCGLTSAQYGLVGACALDAGVERVQGGPRTQLARIWPDEPVRLAMANRPGDPAPWRGSLVLPGRIVPFEIDREGSGRLVMRTGVAWVLVNEWAQTGPRDFSLFFGLADYPHASVEDLTILREAIVRLDTLSLWDRADDRDCSDTALTGTSLFCLLFGAVEDRMGRYHHRQPALEVVRAVIAERWPDRLAGHALMDFNNHPHTTSDDLRDVLDRALIAVRMEMSPSRVPAAPLRVFFLGRSEFGAGGGIPAPFEQLCALAGRPCNAYRHWDFVEQTPGNGLRPRIQGKASDPRVAEILRTERFDVVVFSVFDYNTEFFSPEPEYSRQTLRAAEEIYTMIVESGARPVLYLPYATLDNPSDSARISAGLSQVVARLDSLASVHGTPPVLPVPVGRFFEIMASEIGSDRWFADPQHPGPLGQYGVARLLFSFINFSAAGEVGHPDTIAPPDREAIDRAIRRLR